MVLKFVHKFTGSLKLRLGWPEQSFPAKWMMAALISNNLGRSLGISGDDISVKADWAIGDVTLLRLTYYVEVIDESRKDELLSTLRSITKFDPDNVQQDSAARVFKRLLGYSDVNLISLEVKQEPVPYQEVMEKAPDRSVIMAAKAVVYPSSVAAIVFCFVAILIILPGCVIGYHKLINMDVFVAEDEEADESGSESC